MTNRNPWRTDWRHWQTSKNHWRPCRPFPNGFGRRRTRSVRRRGFSVLDVAALVVVLGIAVFVMCL
jgi:hypothetical protein